MEIKFLEKVMRNFDESYLYELLGDLKDSLLEWSIEFNLLLKKNIISIIVSSQGLKLLEDEKFRYNFYLSFDEEDIDLLKKICKKAGVDISKTVNHEDIASKLSKIRFGDQEPYKFLITECFGIKDYVFRVKINEDPIEICTASSEKFYELYDYQYMIKQQVINDLSNPDKELYKISST